MGPTTRRLAVSFVLSLLFFAGAQAARSSPPEPIRRATVRVYDHVGVPERTLRLAEDELRRIFRQADIGLDWVFCYRNGEIRDTTCNLPARPSELQLSIVEKVPAEISGRKLAPETCGLSLQVPDPGENRRLTVFHDCVKRTAEDTGVPSGLVLAYVAAHELCHLLLGTRTHSTDGIMRARLRPEDWWLASQGRLQFAAAEIERMQIAVAARMRPPDAVEVAVAGRRQDPRPE